MSDFSRFGLTIPQRGAFFGLGTLPELLQFGAMADQAGMGSVFVGDSITAKPRPEALTLLSYLAGITENVRLGVGCMASFPVRDPVVLAYQWATLDQVSNGRAWMIACTGIVAERDASNVEGSHFGGIANRDRPSRMVEHMALMREIWKGEEFDWDGQHHRYKDLQVETTPVQDPCPIDIAANPFNPKFSDRAMLRVATHADGWMTVPSFPNMIRDLGAILKGHLVALGKDPDTYPITGYVNANVGSERNECLDESFRFLEAYYGPVFSEEMTESWTAAGTPEQCAARLREYFDQGATHLTIRMTAWDQPTQVRRLIEEVLPLV